MKDPKDMASFVYGIRDEVIALGLDLIKETLEDCNQMLCDSAKRKQSWEVVRTDGKKQTTCLGTVCFEKTLFRNKQTRESASAYLLDRILGIERAYESCPVFPDELPSYGMEPDRGR